MNKYTKNLERIEFVVTNGCSGHCKHCSQGDHNDRIEHIDGEVAANVIEDVCNNYNITSLMTFGGEPLLYPEVTAKIQETAKKCNIKNREIITNGYFSKDAKKIKEVAKMIANSGITLLLLSVDAFHQETIPIDKVELFANLLLEHGVNIEIHPAYLVSEVDENEYNLKTRKYLQRFTDKGIKVSSGNVILPIGNAKKHFGKYYDKHKEYISPYQQDCENITAISINPNGDTLGGNIYKENIIDMLNAYEPK